MADSGTAPRYRSEVIVLADEQAIAVEDEVGQAGGAAVLSECLLNPMKELSGELTAKELPGALVSSTPAAAQVVWEEELPGALVSSTPAAAQVVWEGGAARRLSILYPCCSAGSLGGGAARRLSILCPCCSAGSLGGGAATGRNFKGKKPADNYLSSQRVGRRITPPPPPPQ